MYDLVWIFAAKLNTIVQLVSNWKTKTSYRLVTIKGVSASKYVYPQELAAAGYSSTRSTSIYMYNNMYITLRVQSGLSRYLLVDIWN